MDPEIRHLRERESGGPARRSLSAGLQARAQVPVRMKLQLQVWTQGQLREPLPLMRCHPHHHAELSVAVPSTQPRGQCAIAARP